MRKKQLLRPCVMLSLAGTLTVAAAQGVLRPCDSLPPGERESAELIGACRERAPIVDVVPRGAQVPRVVGLTFDDARSRLGGFTVRRSYVASAEPGGTVLQQQPPPPARLGAGAVVHLVVSDGSLRPAPQVAADEIDGVRKPAEAPAPPAISSRRPARQSTASPAGRSNEVEARKATATSPASKSTVTSRSSAERPDTRTDRTKTAQTPPPSAVAQSAAPVVETLELPNVIGRSSADATAALTEFQVDRIEVVANAAPSGQVLAQDPAPGTQIPAGTPIGLQVSDGSLANAAAAPQVAPTVTSPARPAASAPARAPMAVPSLAVLLLIAGVLLGLALGAVLMRRWLVKRPAADTEAFAPTVVPTPFHRVEIPAAASIANVPEPAPVPLPTMAAAPITFAARIEEGETTIEFTAPVESDEMTLEYSRDFHE
jgi:beta-lactam-binding protein with PASTA domain